MPAFHRHCASNASTASNLLEKIKNGTIGIEDLVPELEKIAEAGTVTHSLTDFDTVADVAARTGYIKDEDVKRLLAFRDDPSDESWIGGK